MFRKRRRYQEPVDILAEFNEALLSSLELKPVLRHLLEAVLATLDAERTAVFLYRAETDELRGEVATGRGQNYTVSAIALPVRTPGSIQDAFFAPPEGFHQEGEYLVPIIEQEAPAGGRALCWGDPPQRCNLTPRITYEDRPKVCPRCPHFGSLGVLSVEGRLEEEAERLLPVMARSTALAVRNARVFEEVQLHREELTRHTQQLELINDLARQIIRNLNLADVLHTLATRLHKDFGYYRVTIAINQGGTLRGYLTLVDGKEYWTQEHTRIHLSITQSDDPFARAARGRRPVIACAEDLPSWMDVASMGYVPITAYIPISAEEEVIGVVAVDYGPDGRSVNEEELSYIEILANIAGIAIKNAQAYQELNRLVTVLRDERTALEARVRELEALTQASRALREAETPLKVAERLVELAPALLPAHGAAVMFLEGDHLRVVATSGHFRDAQGRHALQGEGPAWDVLEHGPTVTSHALTSGTQVLAPLHTPEGNVLGVLIVGREDHHPYTPHEVRLAEVLAEAGATALLRAQRDREARLLLEGALFVTTERDPATLAQVFAHILARVLGQGRAVVWLDPEGSTPYTLLGSVRLAREERETLAKSVLDPDREGWADQATTAQTPIATHSTAPSPGPVERRIREALGADVLLVVPIPGFGVAYVAPTEARVGFSDHELQLCATLARLLTTGLERSRLEREQAWRAKEREAVAAVGEAVLSTHAPEQLLERLAELSLTYAQADGAYLVVFHGEEARFVAASGAFAGTVRALPPFNAHPLPPYLLQETAHPVPDLGRLPLFPQNPFPDPLPGLLLPLQAHERLIGVLILARQNQPFTQEDTAWTHLLRTPLALAVQSAITQANLEAYMRAAEARAAIGEAIVREREAEQGRTICKTLAQYLGVQHAQLFLANHTAPLVLFGQHGLAPQDPRPLHALAEEAVRQDAPVVRNTPNAPLPFAAALPLKAHGETSGVLLLASRAPITPETLVKATDVTDMLGPALDAFKLNQALAREREKLQDALEYMGDCVIVLEGDAGFANLAARKALNLPRHVRTTDLPPPLLPALEEKELEVQLKGRFYSAIGTRRGELAILVMRDLTERKRAEAALRESEERYRRLVDASPVPIVVHVGGRFVYANAAAARLLGADQPSELIGREVLEFVHPDSLPTVRERMAKLMAGAKQIELAEEQLIRLDGRTICVEVIGRRTEYMGEPAIQVAFHDITAQKAAERMKSEFISAVSHELRTPLASIMGFTQLLLEEEASEEEAREFIRIIHDNSQRLKNMVDNLLDTSRLEAGRFAVYPKPTPLTPLLEDISKSFLSWAQLSGIAFEREIPELPCVNVDPERIGQVVMNLLSNAFKFTPQGGRVTLRAWVEAKWVYIQVQDTGKGIAKEELPHLFKRFSRTQSAVGQGVAGTGLGLYISKAIVEAHGGRIWAESSPGQGATFTFTLPLEGGAPHNG